MDNVTKTVFDTQVRTRCEPKVTYVTREIPVYNVVAKPASPCPPNTDCGQGSGAASGGAASGGAGMGGGASGGGMYAQEFASIDTNGDGHINMQEYAAARMGPSTAAVSGGAS